MFSRRFPDVMEPNAWALRVAALREAGALVADLTESNPTRTGLAPLAEAAAALASVPALPYEPAPLGMPSARAAVAASLSVRNAEVRPEQIALTASTSEAYASLFRLLGDPSDAILAPAPSYPLCEPIAHAEGLTVRTYPLSFDGRWRVDRGAMESLAPGARAIVLVEPNHPTGSCLDADDRAFVEELAARHDMALVVDAVFADFARDPERPLPTWLGAHAVPTFVLGGLSKRCGLPHLKLGWIVVTGPDAPCRQALEKLEWLGDLFLGVAAPVQYALPELLTLRHGFAARVAERIGTNVAALERLAGEHRECTLLPADGGWSAVLRVPATRTDEEWALALLERGVVVHPGHFYDFEAGEHLVVSLIVEPATFAAGLAAIAAELKRT
jgi:aspartate/methionine/tyrosine aminotransferase